MKKEHSSPLAAEVFIHPKFFYSPSTGDFLRRDMDYAMQLGIQEKKALDVYMAHPNKMVRFDALSGFLGMKPDNELAFEIAEQTTRSLKLQMRDELNTKDELIAILKKRGGVFLDSTRPVATARKTAGRTGFYMDVEERFAQKIEKVMDELGDTVRLTRLQPGQEMILDGRKTLFTYKELPHIDELPNFEGGDVKFNPNTGEFWNRDHSGSLTYSEAKLMHLLTSNAGKVVSNNTLLNFYQSDGGEPEINLIRGLIGKIRKRLSDQGKLDHHIESIKNVGYRFNP